MRTVGHTLVELLVVMAMLALLAGIAVPALVHWRQALLVTAAADPLLQAAHQARLIALTHGQPVRLCLADAQGRCLARALSAGDWAVWRDAPSPHLLRHQRLPAPLRVQATRTASTWYGTPQAGTTATFTVCDGSGKARSRQVVISQTGRPRLQSLAGRGCG